jgi:hypothetical protein
MTESAMNLLRVAACAGAALASVAGCSAPPLHGVPVEQAAVGHGSVPTDQDISDAYLYLLGRIFVLRQQGLDFQRDGFKWNQLVYRAPGAVAWANPNLDVAYSEAWVAVDEKTCVRLDMPKVDGRYYTWHMLNGWGETVLNINERSYPEQPSGAYALCMKGAGVSVPPGLLRIDLPGNTFRVLARIELGADAREAARLQRLVTLTPLGQPHIDPPPVVPSFSNARLPGVEAFDLADAILNGEPDINPGMETVRRQAAAVAALVRSGADGRARVDQVVREKGLRALQAQTRNLGKTGNGWIRPATVGNYGSDYKSRTVVNLSGIWANNGDEVTYFGNRDLDGGATYSQTFPADALPSRHARYFWSVTAVDSRDFRVIPNRFDRYLLNNQSALRYNADGSLTIVFAPTLPPGTPESNWLPTPAGGRYNLTFRYYGPDAGIAGGRTFPPQLVKQD